jgi:hypothetical protein
MEYRIKPGDEVVCISTIKFGTHTHYVGKTFKVKNYCSCSSNKTVYPKCFNNPEIEVEGELGFPFRMSDLIKATKLAKILRGKYE